MLKRLGATGIVYPYLRLQSWLGLCPKVAMCHQEDKVAVFAV